MDKIKLAAFWDELEKISMEKEAFDPLTIAGLGALSHLGMNAAVKATHHTGLAKSIRSDGMARGIRSALEGKPQGLGSRLAETWVGPELIAPEHVGRVLGSDLRGQTVGRRYRTLKKLRKAVAMSPELPGAPITEDIVGGVNRALREPLPKAGPVQKAGLLSRVIPAVSVPLVGAVEPSAVVHAGVNALRKGVAKSDTGQRFMRDQFVTGVTEGLPSTTASRIMDTVVSPAAYDTRRLGHALRNAAMNEPQVTRSVGAVHNILGGQRIKRGLRQVEGYIENPEGGMARLREVMGKSTTPPTASPMREAVSPSSYGLPMGARV